MSWSISFVFKKLFASGLIVSTMLAPRLSMARYSAPATSSSVEPAEFAVPLNHLLRETSDFRASRKTPGDPIGIEAGLARYINSAIDRMQSHSIKRNSIDWALLRRQTLERAAGAAAMEDAYLAIVWALIHLKDCHSFFVPPPSMSEEGKRRFYQRAGELYRDYDTCERPKDSPFAGRSSPESHIDEARELKLAHVIIPQCPTESNDYGPALARAVSGAASRAPTTWIVDLRGNGGGNMWPMLAGIGPVLGEGVAGAFVDADGRAVSWGYADGAAWIEGRTAYASPSPLPVLTPAPPVAVLIDRGTTSSGEAIAVAFRGRANTRFFGERTYGLSTANAGHSLDDGAAIWITGAMDRDRAGVDYPHGVDPDEIAAIGDSIPPESGDPALRAAERWLRSLVSPPPLFTAEQR